MAGFYTEYFSTLLKGLGATAFKERREISRVINNLRKADHLLYRSIFENVEEKHRVTRALREEEKLIGELKKSAENSYLLVFNVSTEELTLLGEIKKILERLEAMSKSIAALPDSSTKQRLRKLERNFALAIFEALRKGESEGRDEYRQIELIINEAEEEDSGKFMAGIRLAFQKETSQTVLAKFAARSSIRKAKLDIQTLMKLSGKLDDIKRKLGTKKPVDERILNEILAIGQEIKRDCVNAFYELFLILRRASLIVLKLLLDLNNLKQFNEKWVERKFMPKQQVEEKNSKIDEVEGKVAEHFHTIAQAFRIIISKIQQLENEAKKDAS